MKPICFLAYVRSLNRNLIDPKVEDKEGYIERDRIMFCQDGQGIFDNHYPGSVRDLLGFSGWGHVNQFNILEIMEMLYWFRSHKRKRSLEVAIEKAFKSGGVQGMTTSIKQTLHTINGLLVKKFMVFGPELGTYHDLADQTGDMFLALMEEYSFRPESQEEYEFPVYKELKEMFNFCKSIFYKGPNDNRASWLEWKFRHPATRKFFESEMTRLQTTIEAMKRTRDANYTESPAWFFRSSLFSQTRNLGYLPNHLADLAFGKFRDTVSRPVEPLSNAADQLIRLAVVARLKEGGITPDFLISPSTDEEKELAQRVLSNIDLDLKGTASLDHTVKDGGKLEDARCAISLIRENEWRIPVRNLEDNSIKGFIGYESDNEAQWNHLLFWFSYQLALNWCAERDLEKDEFYFPFRFREGSSEDYSKDILEASIVHIMEPGKIRDLVKGTGELAWVLTPAAKIFQATLAILPEHKAGLEMASHDWAHNRRISSESDESAFLFDEKGAIHPDVRHAFKDWTESTDFISKRVGVAHLSALGGYIGFPRAYLKLVIELIRQRQPVREVVTHRYKIEGNLSNEFTVEKVSWSGFIREGFMMGLPVTKPVLHLIHISERMVVQEFLRRRGIFIEEAKFAPRRKQGHIQIPRVVPGTGVIRTE